MTIRLIASYDSAINLWRRSVLHESLAFHAIAEYIVFICLIGHESTISNGLVTVGIRGRWFMPIRAVCAASEESSQYSYCQSDWFDH